MNFMDPWERFLQYVKLDPSGCHLWTGPVNAWGYGKFTVGGRKGKQYVVHRYAYEHATGAPIPKGLVVAHQCNVKLCVNSEHLRAQTQRENILYSYQDPRRGRRSGRRIKKWRRPPPISIPWPLDPAVEARFWPKVGPVTPEGCRLWLGGAPVTTGGYGKFALTSKQSVPSHRLAAQLYARRVLLPHEVVQHQCIERRCLAEAHLVVSSQRENVADAIKLGTHHAVLQSRAKLNFEIAEEIRQKHYEGESQLDLARAHGVSQTTVWKILNKVLWVPKVWSGPVEEAVRSTSTWPYATGRTDWETPPDFFAEVDARFHFTLDVCATEANRKCTAFFSIADDALMREWTGVCWMNPPYGKGIEQWLMKARKSADRGAVVVALVPANTSTRWWHRHVLEAGAQVEFIPYKLTFVGAPRPAPFASALAIYRPSSCKHSA